MADKYGAAQPLIDAIVKPVLKARELIDALPFPVPAAKKADTSWHEKMVKEANEGFRKAAVSGKKKAISSTAANAKRASRKAPAKKTAGKRISAAKG